MLRGTVRSMKHVRELLVCAAILLLLAASGPLRAQSSEFNLSCNADEVLVGYRGTQGDNGYVLHLHEISCARWQPATRSAAGAGATRAQPIRPNVMPTTRPRPDVSDVPAITLASPRPFELKIGIGRRVVNLSGRHLDRVTYAAVVTADGREASGFEAAIAGTQRSADRLSVSLVAGKAAAPGDYALRLTYELDDPRPQTTPGTSSGRRPVLRTVVVPTGTLAIRARAMTPSITQVTPAPLELGRDYTMIRAAVAELPGTEVVSVTRFPFSGSDRHYCDFAGTYHSPEESLSTGWLGEHNLEIRLSPGRLIPRSSSGGCVLRFSVTTRNELGDQFVSMPEARIEFQPAEPDPRKAYRVNNTRELKPYVAFREEPYNVGVCSGTSPGPSGLIRVGVIDEANDIALRIRSGPIGTKCTWMVYPTGLRDGWELRMTFEEQRVGNKCSPGTETSAGGSFEFGRMAPLYFQGGVLTLSKNNPQGEIPPYDMTSAAKYFRYVHLACGPTLTNDHGVTLRMVSAELYGPSSPNCTWRCGVKD